MSFYSTLACIMRPLTKMLWPTKVINIENFNNMKGGLVICNHYTKVDAIIPTAYLFKKEIHVLCKAEAFESAKIANWFLHKIGAIPVHRGEADIEAVKAVLTVLKEDKKLLLYPEGTRNREGTKDMREFKEGTARFAIKTKKPILPMIYYNSPKAFKRNYLYIGEPIYLDKFYGAKGQDAYVEATKYIYDKMIETRKACDEYVENLKKRK